MKNSMTAALFLVILIAGWMVSFGFTRSRAIADWQRNNPTWLNQVSDEIIQTDEDFCQWADDHKKILNRQRLELAQLFEDPESEEALILNKVEQIASTHEELLRGICQHLKLMHTLLPEVQKELLRGFCRQGLKGKMHRRGQDVYGQNGQQGGPEGAGPGNGYRRGQRRGICGMTRQLQLTEEQQAVAQQHDPAFEEDVRELQNRLFAEQRELLLLFESGQAPNGQVTEQFDRFINAYNALEKRLIRYVLVMRPCFTGDQQKKIIGLCRNNCPGERDTVIEEEYDGTD